MLIFNIKRVFVGKEGMRLIGNHTIFICGNENQCVVQRNPEAECDRSGTVESRN
jgi:hypothetical protein